MNLHWNSSKVIRNLFLFVGLLLIGHLLTIVLLVNYPSASIEGSIYNKIVALFNFNLEANLPTFFSALLLLGNGILLTCITTGHKNSGRKYLHWVGMAFVFCLLSIDEMIKIHEHLRIPTEKLLNTSGFFKYAWFIPYGIIIVILGIIYFKFFMSLPKSILKLFIISAFLFISGAVVMEGISGIQEENYGVNNLGYYVMYTIEELLEMSGSILFFYALLNYIAMTFEKVIFTVKKV